MKRIKFLPGLILLLLSGCQTMSYEDFYDDPTSVPPVGTIVRLNQPLTFQRGSSRSYIQDGEAKPFKSVHSLEPSCMFYLFEPYEAMGSVRTIEPDNFIVTHSAQWIDIAGMQPSVYAFSSIAIGNMFYDGVSAQNLSTTMKLQSDRQPQVVELKCTVFDDPFYSNFVSVNQIVETLGDVVTLDFGGS